MVTSLVSGNPSALLKIIPSTFTFKGTLYRVKTFRNINYPEIFSMVDAVSSV